MATRWGRKETAIWPPQVPLYTYGTLLLTIPIAFTLLFGIFRMKPFLARNYTGSFLKSAAGAEFNMHGSYRLIYLGGGKLVPRVALPGDFAPGSTRYLAVSKSALHCRLQRRLRDTRRSSVGRRGSSRIRRSICGFSPPSSEAMTFSAAMNRH